MSEKKSLLQNKYETEVVKTLRSEYGIKNLLAVPKIEKIIVNAGIGQLSKDKAKMERFIGDIKAITGAHPQMRPARVSIAGFNVRERMVVGLRVTLRGVRAYDFLLKLISIILPRLRDFRGVPVKSFDKNGNYTLGISEHTVFPEIDIAKSEPRGIEITIVTNTNDQAKSKRLLELMGMPFEKGDN